MCSCEIHNLKPFLSLKLIFLEKCSNKEFNRKISNSRAWDFHSYLSAGIIAKKWLKTTVIKKDFNMEVKYYNGPPMKRNFRLVVFRFHKVLYVLVIVISLVVWEMKKDSSHSELIETYLTAEGEEKSWWPSSLWNNKCEYQIKLDDCFVCWQTFCQQRRSQVHPVSPSPSCLNLHNASAVSSSLQQHPFAGTGLPLLLRILCFDAAA